MTTGEMGAGRKRAKAMTPQERREAIITSTLPLLRQYGYGLTTRQIAEAAGVAEGTVFRVFADKRELIQAVVDQAFAIEPLYEAVTAIDQGLPLAQRLQSAVDVLLDAIGDFRELIMVLHASAEAGPQPSWHGPPGQGRHGPGGKGEPQRFVAALSTLLAPDASRLTQPPDLVAAIAVGAVMATMMPGLSEPGELRKELTAQRICDVILNGCLRH